LCRIFSGNDSDGDKHHKRCRFTQEFYKGNVMRNGYEREPESSRVIKFPQVNYNRRLQEAHGNAEECEQEQGFFKCSHPNFAKRIYRENILRVVAEEKYFCVTIDGMNLLFVCSRNKWRSRTAEVIFKKVPGHAVRSAGTHPSSEVRLTEKLFNWANLVFVMENEHKDYIREKFKNVYDKNKIVVLDIPDEYRFMDEELILSLKNSVSPFLKEL
jgi:predicted protein tyrosine phosphatase